MQWEPVPKGLRLPGAAGPDATTHTADADACARADAHARARAHAHPGAGTRAGGSGLQHARQLQAHVQLEPRGRLHAVLVRWDVLLLCGPASLQPAARVRRQAWLAGLRVPAAFVDS